MERADLLYSGLMYTAEVMSILWTAVLLAAAYLVFCPSRKSEPAAATISSTRLHGPQEPTPPGPISEALSQRPSAGRAVRSVQ